MNLLAYRRLIESGELDDSKGNYVQIEHGKLVCCGEKISVEKYNELFKKNPGMVYAPVKHDKVIIRVSSTLDTTEKEWQVCVCFLIANKYWFWLGTFFCHNTRYICEFEEKISRMKSQQWLTSIKTFVL